jgi:putative transposase
MRVILGEFLKDWKIHYCQARPHASLGPRLPEPPDGLPVPPQTQRYQIAQAHRLSAKPILGGLHHEYRLEKIAA